MINETIWKYQIPFEDKIKLDIPSGHKILCVQLDKKTNSPCIWVQVNPYNPKETVYLEMFGTGNPIHNDIGISREYIGTFQYQNGEFVGHLFLRID